MIKQIIASTLLTLSTPTIYQKPNVKLNANGNTTINTTLLTHAQTYTNDNSTNDYAWYQSNTLNMNLGDADYKNITSINYADYQAITLENKTSLYYENYDQAYFDLYYVSKTKVQDYNPKITFRLAAQLDTNTTSQCYIQVIYASKQISDNELQTSLQDFENNQLMTEIANTYVWQVNTNLLQMTMQGANTSAYTNFNGIISIKLNNQLNKQLVHYIRCRIVCDESNQTATMPQWSTYFDVLDQIKITKEVNSTQTGYEIVDVGGLMLNIITMPFTFISMAFNLTIFPNTPYEIDISRLFLSIIAVLVLVMLIKTIIKISNK